jgi:hypothetical protein
MIPTFSLALAFHFWFNLALFAGGKTKPTFPGDYL